jgi:hypothetical protein
MPPSDDAILAVQLALAGRIRLPNSEAALRAGLTTVEGLMLDKVHSCFPPVLVVCPRPDRSTGWLSSSWVPSVVLRSGALCALHPRLLTELCQCSPAACLSPPAPTPKQELGRGPGPGELWWQHMSAKSGQQADEGTMQISPLLDSLLQGAWRTEVIDAAGQAYRELRTLNYSAKDVRYGLGSSWTNRPLHVYWTGTVQQVLLAECCAGLR